LDDYLKAAEMHWSFSGAALVAVDGRTLLSRGYGSANIAIGEPNTPETKFFIGSITKQFTATAILKLQEQGRLNIDSPITKYLPDFPAEPGNRITVRHLLSHQSGLPCYTDNPEILLRRMEGISQRQLLDIITDDSLEFEPGERFKYSNSGYILLGEIIEAVSGQSYEAYLHHDILKPIGMLNTGYARREAGLPQRADGYTLAESGQIVDACRVDYSILHTAGALYSTVLDMLKWDQALYTDDILSRKTVAEMLTPGLGNYGLGWVIENRWGQRVVHHGGFLDGFNSRFERYPDSRLCVIVFSNEDNAPVKKIARGLAAIVLGQPYAVPAERPVVAMDPQLYDEYEGAYDVAPGSLRYVERSGDTLYTHLTAQARKRLLPAGIDTFFFASDNTVSVAFLRDDSGNVASYIINDDPLFETGVRLPPDEAAKLPFRREPVKLDEGVCESYAGTYHVGADEQAAEPTLTLVVSCVDSRTLTVRFGAYSVDLQPVSQTEFIHRTADFGIEFINDGAGRPTACTLRMGNRSVTGRKTD
jgi:CubicO group peptidase (beta-lactamase class C family)